MINVWYFTYILSQTTIILLNGVICTAHFSNNFDSLFNKKTEKFFSVCVVRHVKKEEKIKYLKRSFLKTENHYISH